MTGKDIIKQLNEADMEKIGQYMKVFDRILLYSLAVHTIPPEGLEETFVLWDKIIKHGIDEDAKLRTNFMESYEGRKAKYQKEPDGEDLRLYCLKQYAIAKNIIRSNLSQNREGTEEEGTF
jgi:hypothetical protein